MSEKCRQKESIFSDDTCSKEAAFRFTWPGSNESFICLQHADKLKNVARAMGVHVQLIALTQE